MRRNRPFFVGHCLLLLLTVGGGEGSRAYALDPRKALTQYQLDVWTERDGLPQGSVQAIAQTTDGYLWLGTRDGLARFDGARFRVFRAEDTPGLAANDIRALLAGPEGDLWIGTFNSGLVRYHGGAFRPIGQWSHYPTRGVLDIVRDSRNRLWLGGWNALMRYDGKTFSSYTATNGLVGRNPWALSPDQHGGLWVGSTRGVARLVDDVFHPLPWPEHLPNHWIRSIYCDRAGVLWIGTLGGGLVRHAHGEYQLYTERNGLADDKVRHLLEDRDRNLWIATWGGLSRLTEDSLTSLTHADGLPQDSIESLFEDLEGSLWLGTRGGGLARLRDGTFTVFTAKEGLPGNSSKCVYEARDGALWVGTDGAGLGRYDGTRFENFSTREGLKFVWSLAEDLEGNMWAGCARPAAICRINAGGVVTIARRDALRIEQGIRALHVDAAGTLWAGGSDGGVCRLRHGVFSYLTEQDGLPAELVRVIQSDRAGNIWIGTGAGLCRWREGKLTVYTTRHGLAHDAVYSIHETDDGVLWFGTQGGLSRFHNDQFESYRTGNGLLQNLIYQILDDEQGNLWMSSNRGIFRLDKNAIDDFRRGRAPKLRCVPYSVADGLKTGQCEGGSQPAGFRGADFRLFFATAQGVARIDTRHLRRNLEPPTVLIEQVTAGDQILALEGAPRLHAGRRNVRFEFTALSLAAPDKVRFKYKLEGFDDDWVDSENRRFAFYPKLTPGSYRFRVKACNNDGVWNDTGAAFAFSLAPRLYQTTGFYLACISALALAGWSFHRWRLQQARKQFSAVLAERNRIARDLHDTLAQGFTGLAFQLEAVATKLWEAPEQAQRHLGVALSMVRHSVAEARRSVMNLRSPALTQNNLMLALSDTARQTMAHKPVDLACRTSGRARFLPAALENDLLHVGQEAITNSLKYSAAEHISIDLDFQPRQVTLRIADDGCGFDPKLLQANGGSPHFGLLGMHERARQVGGQLTVHSAPGAGTQIVFAVPLP